MVDWQELVAEVYGSDLRARNNGKDIGAILGRLSDSQFSGHKWREREREREYVACELKLYIFEREKIGLL